MTNAQADRVAFLVGHHHTLKGIDGPDWQTLIEADFFANATEGRYGEDKVRRFAQRVMRTESGKRLARAEIGVRIGYERVPIGTKCVFHRNDAFASDGNRGEQKTLGSQPTTVERCPKRMRR